LDENASKRAAQFRFYKELVKSAKMVVLIGDSNMSGDEGLDVIGPEFKVL